MGPEGGCAVSHVFLNAWGFESPDFVKWAMCISQTAVFGVSGPSFRKSNFSVLNSPIFSFRRKNTALSCGVFAVYLFCQHILELLGRFELPTSSLPTAVEPSSPCCTRLCGGFLSKKDEVAACLFHCFRPLISPCGSACGSELLQDMNKGPAFGNGNPPILLIAGKRLKLYGTYSVISIPQAWQKMK